MSKKLTKKMSKKLAKKMSKKMSNPKKLFTDSLIKTITLFCSTLNNTTFNIHLKFTLLNFEEQHHHHSFNFEQHHHSAWQLGSTQLGGPHFCLGPGGSVSRDAWHRGGSYPLSLPLSPPSASPNFKVSSWCAPSWSKPGGFLEMGSAGFEHRDLQSEIEASNL